MCVHVTFTFDQQICLMAKSNRRNDKIAIRLTLKVNQIVIERDSKGQDIQPRLREACQEQGYAVSGQVLN